MIVAVLAAGASNQRLTYLDARWRKIVFRKDKR
jgi:hypothetical protein